MISNTIIEFRMTILNPSMFYMQYTTLYAYIMYVTSRGFPKAFLSWLPFL